MRTLPALVLVGAGLVLLPSPADAATPSCNGVRATIVGTRHADVMKGTAHRDVIVAGRGDDIVYGNGGNDLICGGFGADRLEGGPGRDHLLGEGDRIDDEGAERCLHGDGLDGGGGDDVLDPGGDSRHHLYTCDWNQVRFRHGSGHGVYVDLESGNAAGQGHDTIVYDTALEVVGSDRNDRIYGTNRSERFDPRKGKDEVYAAGGDDRVDEGKAANGDDLYDMGEGDDTLITFRGHDAALGGGDDDELILLNPARMGVDGGNGADRISRYAVPAGERVDGGEGPDLLNVILRDDPGPEATLDIPAGTLTVNGNTETVSGFESWNFVSHDPLRVIGSDQSETVRAAGWGGSAEAPVTASMGGGDDTVEGGAGDDYVDGGDGTDTAELGGGTNTCVNVEQGGC